MTEKKKRPLRDRLLLVASNSSVVLEAVDELDRLAVIYHHQGKMLPEHAHRATVAERRVRELDESFDRSNMAEDNMPQICLDLKVEQQHLKTITELRKLNTNQYDQITKLEMANEKQKRVIDTLRKCLDVAVKKLAYLGFVEDIERIAKIKEDGGIK